LAHESIPDVCDVAAYSADNVFKICCTAATPNVPYLSNI
jgi:hypothetical protein